VQNVGAQADALQVAGAKVLHHRVGALAQAQEQLAPLCVAEPDALALGQDARARRLLLCDGGVGVEDVVAVQVIHGCGEEGLGGVSFTRCRQIGRSPAALLRRLEEGLKRGWDAGGVPMEKTLDRLQVRV